MSKSISKQLRWVTRPLAVLFFSMLVPSITLAQAGGIARIDADGTFIDYLVAPGSTHFPGTAYLEYGYNPTGP